MAPRIKPNKNPSKPAQTQLDSVNKMLGTTPNIFATIAHSPAALEFYLSGIIGLSKTKIPAPLREQISLAVASANKCDYCASAHTAFAKRQKVAEAELTQNMIGKSKDPKVAAALAFAQKVVSLRGNISDDDFQAIKNAGYSEEEIVEIVAIVCQNIFTNYFNHIAKTEIDFDPVVSTRQIASV